MTKTTGIAKLKSDFLDCIDTLVDLLKFDDYTYTHSLNVANYAVEFARCLNKNIDESTIYYCGLLHDIGKIDISLDLLHKKEKLSPKELRIIQEHPARGCAILSRYNMPEEIVLAAELHHERIDGAGYPYRLTGKEIPLTTKMISICDVFDALISDRPYRKGYSLEQVIHIMSHSVGQFDQALLQIFINRVIKNKFRFIDTADKL